MHKRTVTAASLSALLALGGNIVIAAAQDETPAEPVEETATTNAVSGTIVTMENEAGQTVYYLDVGDELIELHFGPAWFNDLSALFGVAEGDEVEIGGNVRAGGPNENASDTAKEKAAKSPRLKIKSINGEPRPKGKPAWAGGPKVQGEAHPGYDGWSKGQAKKAEKAKNSGTPGGQDPD